MTLSVDRAMFNNSLLMDQVAFSLGRSSVVDSSAVAIPDPTILSSVSLPPSQEFPESVEGETSVAGE